MAKKMKSKVKRPRIPGKPHDMSNDNADGIKKVLAKSSSWKKDRGFMKINLTKDTMK